MVARELIAALVLLASSGCTEDWDFTFGDPPPIGCGAEECDGGEVCCLDEAGLNPSCRSNCELPSFTVACSRPEHCPGEACCASVTDFDGAECRTSCMGTDLEVCAGTENTCTEGLSCAPNESADGVFVCIE